MSAPRTALCRPLRIVQVGAFAYPSSQGSQVFVRGMSRALARRGHQVTVACYGHGQEETDDLVAVVRTPRMPGYRKLRAGPDIIKPVLDLALAVQVARIPADIVHAHNYEASLCGALARVGTGVPMVYCAHNTMAEELPTYFDSIPAKRIFGPVGWVLDRAVPRLADHAQAIRPHTVAQLESLGCKAVSHVAPGVDPTDFDGVAPAVLPPGPWVVYAGNPDHYQDLDVLVSAMQRIPDAGLLLVGASPFDELDLRSLPRVKVVQTERWSEVASLIAASTVAALPRSVCSGYPIKLLNYLGLGLPTVAAAGSAIALPGVVKVPNRDPEAMALALEQLLGDAPMRRELGGAAAAHVRSACTWDARAGELEAVYMKVLMDRAEGVAGN